MVKIIQLKGWSLSTPNKYPAIDENNTLIAKPAFVISLKSRKMLFNENEPDVALNRDCLMFFLLFLKLAQRYFIENDLANSVSTFYIFKL